MFLAGVTFTFLLPVVNQIDMSTNFALGALQVILIFITDYHNERVRINSLFKSESTKTSKLYVQISFDKYAL